MNKLKLKICEVFVKYYDKRWKNAIDNVKKHGQGVVTDEYRKWANLTAKYGKKSLLWTNRKDKILKESE